MLLLFHKYFERGSVNAYDIKPGGNFERGLQAPVHIEYFCVLIIPVDNDSSGFGIDGYLLICNVAADFVNICHRVCCKYGE